MKLAHLIPLLKKPSLCPDYLNNYRSVSLLSFLSKLVERLVGKQLTAHLTQHNLFVSVQLAYQQNHFTETTLLKVVKDLLFAIDGGNAAVLTLMDESVAFDTVDHANLLSRLTALFGISGTVYYSQISSCMSKTKEWMANIYLQLKESKTDARVVYSKFSRRKPAKLPLTIGSTVINPSPSVCNLGVTLDENLSMRKKITKKCRTAY